MALALLKQMGAVQVQPDVVSYTATATSCNRSREWAKALELYRGASTNSVVLYSCAMKACQLGTEWHQALQLFQEMQETSYWPDIAAFNPCLGAVVDSKHWEQALTLLQKMPSLALQPNGGTKRLLLRALSDHWQGSLELLGS
ncbi:Pentatricopeptide repeat-containing protein MRL1 [Durusdinium trenchii]